MYHYAFCRQNFVGGLWALVLLLRGLVQSLSSPVLLENRNDMSHTAACWREDGVVKRRRGETSTAPNATRERRRVSVRPLVLPDR